MSSMSRSPADVRSLRRSRMLPILAYAAVGLAFAVFGYFIQEVGVFVCHHPMAAFCAFLVAVGYLLVEVAVRAIDCWRERS